MRPSSFNQIIFLFHYWALLVACTNFMLLFSRIGSCRVGPRWPEVFYKPINTGVPQGSALDPSLFLLYIYDLPDGMISKVVRYADESFSSTPQSDRWTSFINFKMLWRDWLHVLPMIVKALQSTSKHFVKIEHNSTFHFSYIEECNFRFNMNLM